MLVLLNPSAGGHRAGDRWRRLSDAFGFREGPFDLIVPTRASEIQPIIAAAIRTGERRFVAAGGDGTVSAVVNAVLDGSDLTTTAWIGAIGLGSSNDYHKPLRHTLRGTPVRLSFDTQPVALGTADSDGVRRRFVLNASVGFCAEANAAFNTPDAHLGRLKRISTPAAILSATAGSLRRFRPIAADVDDLPVRLNNLSVCRSPYVAGNFRYDELPHTNGSSLFAHLCAGMSRFELARTLAAMARGHFVGRPKTRSWATDRLSLAAPVDVALEIDGEVLRTRRVEFRSEATCLRLAA